MTATILIVDDEPQLGKTLCSLLERKGYQVSLAANGSEAEEKMAQHFPDVVLMDLKLPDCDGSELMARLKPAYPRTRFIVITAEGSIRSAVKATQRGAVDYLIKPFELEELLVAIRHALKEQALAEEIQHLRSKNFVLPARSGPEQQSIFPSRSMAEMLKNARHAATQDGIVLVLGESGCGKDYLAQWIHKRSRRASGSFFSINCAALAPELAESELFGHEPGAFTGTRGRKRGLLELAEKGTLLLNEVGELSLAMQSKLLTFLDTRSFLRVGGERNITIDARIIAATNRDLEKDVAAGKFRQDLYYRLNVFPIIVPPLRDRREDIPILAQELIGKLAKEMDYHADIQVSPLALDYLQRYDWPGNVRELRNILERALIVANGGTIAERHLNIKPAQREWKIVVTFPSKANGNLHDVTKDVARKLVLEALRRAESKKQAAELLGISRHALAHQIRILGIDA